MIKNANATEVIKMYLEKINTPDDVKKLNTEELKALAAEM